MLSFSTRFTEQESIVTEKYYVCHVVSVPFSSQLQFGICMQPYPTFLNLILALFCKFPFIFNHSHYSAFLVPFNLTYPFYSYVNLLNFQCPVRTIAVLISRFLLAFYIGRNDRLLCQRNFQSSLSCSDGSCLSPFWSWHLLAFSVKSVRLLCFVYADWPQSRIHSPVSVCLFFYLIPRAESVSLA